MTPPTVCLAYAHDRPHSRTMFPKTESPTVRLAVGARNPNRDTFQGDMPPSVRLAFAASSEGCGTAVRGRTWLAPPSVHLAYGGPPKTTPHLCRWDFDPPPALLVSYVYLQGFLQAREGYRYRSWVMDSGAFSAAHSGNPIDLAQYIATCQELLATDPSLVETYSLDVLGDWRATRRNTERMWKAGVAAIPCFHYGEPEDALVGMARDYPKIAIGGAVGVRPKAKRAWASQCFARVWPKPVHGFGFGAAWAVMDLPFHSVDASNWEAGPCRFGTWKTFGDMSNRGGRQDLRAEVAWHLQLEARARQKWAALWAKHPGLCEPVLREV
jgi:hypothetical protein